MLSEHEMEKKGLDIEQGSVLFESFPLKNFLYFWFPKRQNRNQTEFRFHFFLKKKKEKKRTEFVCSLSGFQWRKVCVNIAGTHSFSFLLLLCLRKWGLEYVGRH